MPRGPSPPRANQPMRATTSCISGRIPVNGWPPSTRLLRQRATNHALHTPCQRKNRDRRRAGRHAPAVGPARRAQPEGHQVRLRHRASAAPARCTSAARAVRSCQTPVSAAAGAPITTIEGLSADGTHPVQLAWQEIDVPQCGYCQAGQIMAAAALLTAKPRPTDADDRLRR